VAESKAVWKTGRERDFVEVDQTREKDLRWLELPFLKLDKNNPTTNKCS
jgi:hypothetical protein